MVLIYAQVQIYLTFYHLVCGTAHTLNLARDRYSCLTPDDVSINPFIVIGHYN